MYLIGDVGEFITAGANNVDGGLGEGLAVGVGGQLQAHADQVGAHLKKWRKKYIKKCANWKNVKN